MKDKKKIQFNLFIPKELRDKVKEEAEEIGIPPSSLVTLILREHFKKSKKRR